MRRRSEPHSNQLAEHLFTRQRRTSANSSRKLFVLTTVTIAVVAIWPKPAWACSCVGALEFLSTGAPASESSDRESIDFVGRVVEIDPPRERASWRYPWQAGVTTFRVLRTAGGIESGLLIEIHHPLDSGMCGVRFGMGRIYKVEAEATESGSLVTGLCSLNVKLDESGRPSGGPWTSECRVEWCLETHPTEIGATGRTGSGALTAGAAGAVSAVSAALVLVRIRRRRSRRRTEPLTASSVNDPFVWHFDQT
jgi:hypothetical protein